MSLENKKKYKLTKVWVNVCRLLLGATFVFSGFVKAVDPLGTFYKIQDYLMAFGVIDWVPGYAPLLVAVMLSAIEFGVGVFLLLGIRRNISSWVAWSLMLFMTPLTLFLAITDPISDCGCFGDALVLTNWETFGKNVVLLVAAWSVYRWKKLQVQLLSVKVEWLISLCTFLSILGVSAYCLHYLPILDFRPYHIGANIKQGMEVPEGAKPSVFEARFVLEKEGKRQEFTLENYPDSTWTFVETRNILKEKGYEPPIHDFSMISLETGEDITEQVLADEGYTFLLVAHRIEYADDSNIDLVNEIYDYAVANGYGFYALTSSPEEEIEEWRNRTGAEYAFCQMDDITLKTIIRANPGILLIRGGTILNKWSHTELPDEYVLTDRLENIELGQMKPSYSLFR